MARLRAELKLLLTDPPISDRLAWRGLLRPRASEREDRALHASAFGAVYALAAAAGLLVVASGSALIDDRALLAAAALGAALISVACLLGYRRLPRRFFHLAAAAGTGLATLAALSAAGGSEAVFASFYAFIVMLCFLLFRPGPAAFQAVLATAAYAAVLYGQETEFAPYLLASSTLMLITLGVVIAVLRTRTNRIAGELSSDAYTDKLTGLPNRRAFDTRFGVEVARVERSGRPMALIICDLDRFKAVNDTHGHEVGDEVLRRAAHTIAQRTRTIDLAARIGGEEFGILLADAGSEEAGAAAERIRNGVRSAFAGGEIPLTISCGIAVGDSTPLDSSRLYDQADQALYAAKRAGRDCSAIHTAEGVKVIGGGSAVGRLRQLF